MFIESSGWIAAFSVIASHKAVGAIMIIVAILFTMCAVMSIILLKMVRVNSLRWHITHKKKTNRQNINDFPPFLLLQVHSMYRRTGASFQKAQQEFSQGVFTSKTFQSAAAGAASSAAQGAFQGN